MAANDFLPEEFEFSHEYCFFLHDQLVETLKSAEEAKVFDIHFKFREPDHAKQIEGLSGEKFVQWMELNGYKTEVWLLYYKQICAALLSDFLHFIYEALQCSRKGKLTVTYALLRKPFKENLFLLEWLLARPGEFLERFEWNDPSRFKLEKQASVEDQVSIIREALEHTPHGNWIPAEYLHELRFRKDSPISMESAWQKANHLVTTFRFLETEPCNFNFVFSNDDARYSQWEGLYLVLPILLFHSVQVIEAIVSGFTRRQHHEQDIIPLRTVAGMLLWMKNPPMSADIEMAETALRNQIENAGLNCPKCDKPYIWHSANLLSFYEQGSVSCSNNCGTLNLHVEPGV